MIAFATNNSLALTQDEFTQSQCGKTEITSAAKRFAVCEENPSLLIL
jgi:hypothetical protein